MGEALFLEEAVTYDALGNGLSDGVNLGSVSTTTDANADVNLG